MDNFQKIQQGGCVVQAISCLCCLACSAGAITFMVFLGKFAFSNPDADCIYGELAGVADLYTTEAAATTAGVTADSISDVHGNMVAWFLWGFINAVLPCAGGLVGGLLAICSPAMGSGCGGLIMSGAGCSGFAWWIAGMVWRFRADGSFASGDIMPADTTEEAWATAISADGSLFQVSSGNFMAIYYMITWIMMGVSCGCSLLVAIGGCIASCCK
jgi:hypothetical protein